MPACRSTSATLIAHGSAAPTRTPMGCYANTFQKAPTSACTMPMTLRPLLLHSIPGLAKPLAGKHPRKLSTNCYKGAIHRVLRGPIESSQYASAEYRKMMQSVGFRASMSRRADCYDNAPMESFFHTLKTELVHHQHYATREQAKRDIFAYIEGFYNRTRRHSAIGFLSPIEMELEAA